MHDAAITQLTELIDPDTDWPAPQSVYNLVELARKGVKKAALDRLKAETGLTYKDLATVLHVSERTLQRLTDAEALKPEVSDRLISIFQVYLRGFEVFEEKPSFLMWMSLPSIGLGGVQPKDLLDTSFGIQMILNELGRIEHGVLS